MDDDKHYSEAPFNMAIATLMRLDTILQQIKLTDYMYPTDSAQKQKVYLGLVKQFYINSIPLLKETDVPRYEYILKLKTSMRTQVTNGNQKLIFYYNTKLDFKLNKILIELQQLLRRYFMPKGKDLAKAVTKLD